ncbi:two-component system OmpR family response regulator [Methylosinus sp. sav-2]|nr:two-component system OmpR family response regulator [Methylosinus sp. sav-2]
MPIGPNAPIHVCRLGDLGARSRESEVALNKTHNILIVEDDLEIRDLLASFLQAKGFVAMACGSSEEAGPILAREEIDLVLLDVMLPGADGFEFCRSLRLSGGPRIIMLTALSEPVDKVVGLELGADDYVGKPFDLRELLARIRAVLRRPPVGERFDAELVLRFSGYAFHPQRRFLRSPTGLRVPLTGAETDLLLVFCRNTRRILSREELINLSRGEGFAIAPRSVDLLVSRLRRKLSGDDPFTDVIHTVRADGYAFQPEVSIE